ncbi:MAG: nucleotide exchange factor GrpE [Rhodospirillaceae bacterium]|nr:nucleotide exchange factor GrpE [Rhodospirillaceae bacterium]
MAKKRKPSESEENSISEEECDQPDINSANLDTMEEELIEPEDQSLGARISELEGELADFKDRSLRALADAENTRRRSEREVIDAKKYGSSNLVKDLLNVSDNLHRALEAVGEDVKELDETVKNLVVGVQMVEKEMLDVFEKHGVTKLQPIGEKFNHDFHQAMYEVEDSGQPTGTIVELLQPGYVMHDRLLRPAMVAVAKDTSEELSDKPDRVDTSA